MKTRLVNFLLYIYERLLAMSTLIHKLVLSAYSQLIYLLQLVMQTTTDKRLKEFCKKNIEITSDFGKLWKSMKVEDSSGPEKKEAHRDP